MTWTDNYPPGWYGVTYHGHLDGPFTKSERIEAEMDYELFVHIDMTRRTYV